MTTPTTNYIAVILMIYGVTVLPSIGIGSLLSREAEGRMNVAAGEKVCIPKMRCL